MRTNHSVHNWRWLIKYSTIATLLAAQTAALPAFSCSFDDDDDSSIGSFFDDLGDAFNDFGDDLDDIF